MANRRPQNNGRRMDFGRNDRPKNFGRTGLSPWQGGGPGGGLPNLLPLGGGPTEATLALASNIINLLQPRQNTVPSLLDMPIRRDFGHNMPRFDRGFVPNHPRGMNHNFRRTGTYNRAGERINTNRRPFRPNDGPRQPNKSSPKKDADYKAKPVKESEKAEDQAEGTAAESENNGAPPENNTEPSEDKAEASDDKDDEGPKTRYDDINSQLLRCHICNKSMWDGRSFENHLNGRAHSIMMQKTVESYALTADTMRQEFKICEMKRFRNLGLQPTRDFYCAMCDMYAADGAVHRTTVGHRKLKKYLHPTCTVCHKEIPTRIELDEHRLTAEHMKSMQDKQDVSKPRPEILSVSTMNMERSYVREDRQRPRPQPKDDDKEGENEKEAPANGEPDEKAGAVDREDTILDYNEGDDLSGVSADQFPLYSVERPVGSSFLGSFRVVQCKLCNKLLDSEETGAVHLRTWRHHQLFLRLLHEKSGVGNVKQEAAAEAQKRSLDAEESGNWKRRKTAPVDGDDGANGHDDDDDVILVKGAEEPLIDLEPEPVGEDAAPADDELEDWEQSVDELLHGEAEDTDGDVEMKELEPEVKKDPEPEVKEPEPEVKEPEQPPARAAAPLVKTATPRASPRGRARGRGRRL